MLLLLLRNFDDVLTHIRLECLWNTDRTVLVEIILKECDEHSRWSNNCIVESMCKILASVSSLNSDTMAELNADQMTLLAWEILHEEVMDGGFLQLLYNGYAPFFFQNPFGKMMRLWGLDDVARLINKARKLYNKYHTEIDADVSDDEFMQLYERMPEFDELDDCFVENEEQWTGMVACYIDEHIDRFAKVTS